MNTRIKAPLLAGITLLGTAPVASSRASTVSFAAALAPSSNTLWLDKCPPNECGRNSAEVEQIPLPALDLDGDAFRGFKITEAKTGSWMFAIGQPGYALDVNRFGEFVAVHRGNHERVQSVTIQRTNAEQSRYLLSFEESAMVRSWAMKPDCDYRDGHTSDSTADCYEVAYDVKWYSIEASDELGPERHVCKPVRDWGAPGPAFKPRVKRVRHPHMLGSYAITPWDELTAQAVLVAGEVYDFETAEVDKDTTGRWLNVACAISAVGKMKLMGYDPAETRPDWSTTWKQRQATLKMLTARYCPAANHEEFTKNGQALGFQNEAKWMWPWSKSKLHDSQVEAKWDENGATCLTLPRSSKWRSPEKLAEIRQVCGLPECPDFLPPFGAKPSKTSGPRTKGAAARHPSRPRKTRRGMTPTVGPAAPSTTLPTYTNSKNAQSAAEASFEGQLSSGEEWMTFNRW